MDQEALRTLTERIIPLLGSVGALIGGVAMLIDDYRDFGKVDRTHHWLLGVLSLLGGITGVGLTALDLHRELLKIAPKGVKEPQPLEGVPPKVLEALR